VLNWLKQQSITETKGVFKDLTATIDGFTFVFGLGGIHGSVENRVIESDGDHVVIDLDVSSYYPNLAIVNEFYPAHLGEEFCVIYKTLYEQRKQYAKGTAENAMLKLALNGTYGDSNNQFSPFYDPLFTMSITLNGQLLLCLLAEKLMRIPGLQITQINTDGLTVRVPRSTVEQVEKIRADWQELTGLELEEVVYDRMFIRDVNNYVAVMLNGKTKGKGVFASPSLAKNPDCQIVYDAVAARIANGTPIERTIRRCDDIRRFVTVRRVTGGALWRGENIGKAIRYYYATSVPSEETIRYVKNGNKVPMSEGTRPLMQLPDAFPDDVDYSVYLVAAEKLLCEVGYL
jgi:DNA polymerase elongation subunit (family B)